MKDLELQALAAAVYSDAVRVASINARYPPPRWQARVMTDEELELAEALKEELRRRELMTVGEENGRRE